jgi:predicted nucleotidyltransferase
LRDISGKISPELVEVCRCVSVAAKALGVPYVVVGAAARDLVLHYGYGAPVVRATMDVDFGIQVADAAAYEELKRRLEEEGFETTRTAHRLRSKAGTLVDLVPFGPIAREDGQVLLPPDETHEINVIGFEEACDTADMVVLQTNPEVAVPVASPPGLTLLKLVAWTHRETGERKKDAADLTYLLENYEKIPTVEETLYGEKKEVLERYGWDLSLGGAHLLGSEVSAIASTPAKRIVSDLLHDRIEGRRMESLEYEMCRNDFAASELERVSGLLSAFRDGFTGDRPRGRGRRVIVVT